MRHLIRIMRLSAPQVEHIQLELGDGNWDTMEEQPQSPSTPEHDAADDGGDDQEEEPTPMEEEEQAETAAEAAADEEDAGAAADGDGAGPSSATADGEVIPGEAVLGSGKARKQARTGERKQRRRGSAATGESPRRKGSRSRRRADAPGTA